MPTLARTRGKRGNQKRKIEELQKSRRRSRKAWVRREQEEVERISYLENLPVEMLQRLMIESRNPQLALVSKRLRAQLLSSYTQMQLVTTCFTDISDRVSGPEVAWEKEDHAAVRHLRTLISQTWFTYPLFEAARQKWLLDTSAELVETILSSQGEPYDLDIQNDVRTRLRRMLDQILRAERQTTGASRLQRMMMTEDMCPSNDKLPKEDSEDVCYFEYGSHALWIAFRCTVLPGLHRPNSDINDMVYWCPTQRLSGSSRFRKNVLDCRHIPAALFRRPLTQPTGDLLTSLLAPDMAWSTSAGLVAQHLFVPWQNMLMRALDKGCLAAIYHLWYGVDLDVLTTGREPLVKEDPIPAVTEMWLDPLAIWQDPNHAYHKTPWRLIQFYSQSFLLHRPRPTERHWRCCIQNYCKNSALYLRLMSQDVQFRDHGNRATQVPALSDETLNMLFMLKEDVQRNTDERKSLELIYKVVVDAAIHG